MAKLLELVNKKISNSPNKDSFWFERTMCKEAMQYLESQKTYQQAWDNCENPDWMLYWLKITGHLQIIKDKLGITQTAWRCCSIVHKSKTIWFMTKQSRQNWCNKIRGVYPIVPTRMRK